MTLSTPVSALHRVGKALDSRLKRLGIRTVYDLLYWFPFRYEDFSTITPIDKLTDGLETTVVGTIEHIANKRSSRKRTMITEAIINDGNASLRVVWFGQSFITKNLKSGDMVSLSGKVTEDMFGIQMKSPSYEKVKQIGGETTHTARIVPMYPLTAGITQKQIRFLIAQVIDAVALIEDWIPEEILDKGDLISLSGALRSIHLPETGEELAKALERLKFDELYVLQLRGALIRQSIERSYAPAIPFHQKEIKAFVESLPFTLTKDQKVAAWQILQDMEKTTPMNRLLEGDVGSGKTVVAALVSYNAILSRKQVVIMAPTEILAKQHFESLQQLLPEHTIGLLTGSEFQISNFEFQNNVKTKQKIEFKNALREGDIQIAIGTHALLTDDVMFHDLALALVDEQHRFGVKQRKKIRMESGDLSTTPHFLSMTATPIPRSFALTLYGDLDLSMIKEMPKGRKPVQTRLVEPKQRDKAYRFIREQVEEGRQVFVICPIISQKSKIKACPERSRRDQKSTDDAIDIAPPTGNVEKKSVVEEYERLESDVFSELRIGFLHGKMKAGEKDATMKAFARGELDILVSTSVVEVGVNIPNASVMMIEGAESFGLAQLHQFRGRVGRSDHQSYCFLFTDSDSNEVQKRLSFFEKNTDGFAVAEYDLEMRGPGAVYGTAQSGMMHMKLATLSDVETIKRARELARDIDFEQYPSLREKVEEWEAQVHLE